MNSSKTPLLSDLRREFRGAFARRERYKSDDRDFGSDGVLVSGRLQMCFRMSGVTFAACRLRYTPPPRRRSRRIRVVYKSHLHASGVVCALVTCDPRVRGSVTSVFRSRNPVARWSCLATVIWFSHPFVSVRVNVSACRSFTNVIRVAFAALESVHTFFRIDWIMT